MNHFVKYLKDFIVKSAYHEPRDSFVSFQFVLQIGASKVLYVLRAFVERLRQENKVKKPEQAEHEHIGGALAPIQDDVGRLGKRAHGVDELEPGGRPARLHRHKYDQQHEYFHFAPLDLARLE